MNDTLANLIAVARRNNRFRRNFARMEAKAFRVYAKLGGE